MTELCSHQVFDFEKRNLKKRNKLVEFGKNVFLELLNS
jgi:hypothetical protein